MSDHVNELISLLGNSLVTASELAETIQKDYSLTTKILQVVNSAYYSRGTPVSTISRAVTVVGLDTLRQLATTMALFEEFVKKGSEKHEIINVFTTSLLSANQSKIFSKLKKLRFSAEEAYICTLLHKLGKIIILVYLPDKYHQIQQNVQKGYSEDHSTKIALNGLTYSQIGQEIATFWNFTKRIIDCMDTDPVKPDKGQDSFLYLQNLVVFNNRLTETYFNGSEMELADLIYKFGNTLGINQEQAIELIKRSVEVCENFSAVMREGLKTLQDNKNNLITVTKKNSGQWVRLS
ncbi:MAG: HDOD domain-containing protein [Desulfobulbaceae bacterium]|nr:HDOD domain-containing protein [Desulfobulbaceae bacterium]HIJ79546.1 HDOD domain-containing protein [Deltaproteobacteria bacterium]